MMELNHNESIMLKPGKTVVSVALVKQYNSGTPVFVRCYRKSNTWTLPSTEVDYTDEESPTRTVLSVVHMLEKVLDDDASSFSIKSIEPICDIIDKDIPSRVMMYLAKLDKGIDAYQLYTSSDCDNYRISRFMHQNQLFRVFKAITLELYVKYLRSL